MIIVTGGAGFIGSNLIQGLNDQGIDEIVCVDDLSDGHKFVNIADLKIADYLDKECFIDEIKADHSFGSVEAVYHQGACSTTTEWNGKLMMHNNYDYSKFLLHYCNKHRIPFYYASSAAVYGTGKTFIAQPEHECPLNVYGYSKLLFDQYVRRHIDELVIPWAGFRYFNVYGPREQHKGSMASVAFHLNQQMLDGDNPRLFEGSDGFDAGMQKRDFVYVEDVVNVNLWFGEGNRTNGIFNVGTGRAETFNAVATAVIRHYNRGKIEYISFPEHLKGCYQSFTEADISGLRNSGYDSKFHTVAEGIKKYLHHLNP